MRPRYLALTLAALVAAALGGVAAGGAMAAEIPSFSITLKDHAFTPAELTIPADTKVRLMVKNLDPTPAEFESGDFKVEKIVPAGQEVAIVVRPLKPGAYTFGDEYHEAARGRLIVQ